MTNENSYAFPVTKDYVGESLTKREYFAAAALQGILANTSHYDLEYGAAQRAVLCADKLIKALNETA